MKIDFSKLAAEFVIIVVGVLAALAVTAWYEDSQKRIDERALLQQFNVTLEREVPRLEDRLTGLRDQQEQIKLMLESLDSMESYMENSSGGVTALRSFMGQQFDSSAYEVLKSKGFDLISNGDLRLKILEFYEIGYPAVQAMMENERLLVRNRIEHLIESNFVVSENLEEWTPIDYESISTNIEFHNVARSKLRRLSGYENRTERAVNWGKELIRAIDLELTHF